MAKKIFMALAVTSLALSSLGYADFNDGDRDHGRSDRGRGEWGRGRGDSDRGRGNENRPSAREGWRIAAEGPYLVIRDLRAQGDFRFAFEANGYQNFGNSNNFGNSSENSVLFESGNWSIREENGILVFRDTSGNGRDSGRGRDNGFGGGGRDFRFAFFPGSGQVNFGRVSANFPSRESSVLYSGRRWRVGIEGGIFVIRDMRSPGDNRFAFWPQSNNNFK